MNVLLPVIEVTHEIEACICIKCECIIPIKCIILSNKCIYKSEVVICMQMCSGNYFAANELFFATKRNFKYDYLKCRLTTIDIHRNARQAHSQQFAICDSAVR